MRRPNLKRTFAAGHRGRLGAGIALIAAAAVVVWVVLNAGSTISPTSSSNTPQASGSTTVQRRNLVQTDTQSGTLGYANQRTVYDRLSGTITWLPSVGQVIKPGQTLYEVSGQPVVLLDGTTPAYRDLNASDTAGQDILQLNRSLVALGFNPDGIVVDDLWQAATTAGVDMWQASLGEAETGSVSLGQVVFLPGDQLVSNVEATLGDGGTGGTAAAPASVRPAAANAEFVSLTTTATATTTPTTPTPTTTTPVRTKPKPARPKPARPKPTRRGTGDKPKDSMSSPALAGLTALLRAEAAQLKAAAAALKAAKASSSSGSSPSSSKTSGSSSSKSSSNSSSSGGGSSSSAVLQTASTQLTATVDLDASKQSEAKVGEKVSVQLPAGNTVNGVITAVSPVAQSSSSSGNGASSSAASSNNNGNGNGGSASSGATIPVTIKLKRRLHGAGLDQAAVSVNFIQAVANHVLSVPVTALLATSGGGYAVQEATAPHRLIPITTGLFAAGYAEISGQGIYPGLPVTNSQG